MGVAWLVGTVAVDLLTSAGQRTVEVLTVPSAHTTQEKMPAHSKPEKCTSQHIKQMCAHVCHERGAPTTGTWMVEFLSTPSPSIFSL